MLQRIIIVAGGELGAWALTEISAGDYLIGADRGAQFLIDNHFVPDIAVGDFDSVNPDELSLIQASSREVFACDPIRKNHTDTELALQLAIEKKPAQIVLIGAIGTRLDHSLINIQLMMQAVSQGIKPLIVNETNRIQLISGACIEKVSKCSYPYISLLALSDKVTGITLSGFVYPLQDATLQRSESLGISNELIGEEGTVAITSGDLLIIQSRD